MQKNKGYRDWNNTVEGQSMSNLDPYGMLRLPGSALMVTLVFASRMWGYTGKSAHVCMKLHQEKCDKWGPLQYNKASLPQEETRDSFLSFVYFKARICRSMHM